jgi:phospholipid/cholesterol/gamma-HCH transport system permease protein
MPCLTVISNITAMVGAALVSRWAFDITFRGFAESALDNLLIRDIVSGELKGFLFGLVIGLVSCYKGLTVRGGAAGVGAATTSSVVTSITMVIAFDTLFNIVLVALFD